MLLCACARFCSALAVARIVLSTLSLDAAAARSEYAEDLVRQGCDIDLDPQAGRRAQDEAAETKTGLAKMLQTNPDCSWDTFDGACCCSCSGLACTGAIDPQQRGSWELSNPCMLSQIVSSR